MTAEGAAAAELVPLPDRALPGWCDRFLAPPGGDDSFAGRAWYETVIAHALPPGTTPVLARCGDDALAILRRDGRRIGALTTPYTLLWRPLLAPGGAAERAGHAFGGLFRLAPPVLLDALDAEAEGVEGFLRGVAGAGLSVQRYFHFGNWHERLVPGLGWTGYLEARPPALRNTIGRKLARASRTLALDLVDAPGPALERGIDAYEAVRARSWKPHEPFPDFDRALMRAMAAIGALRLGVLRHPSDEAPVAAQYWVLAGGRATVLKLAHVEAERAASPGTALTAMMIRRLLDEDGVRELDFGRGDDEYKRLWVGARRERIGALIADPRHPAGLAAIARHMAGRARAALRDRLGTRDAAQGAPA